jgi:predicted TIM-barrel fold metal-dependent hydrolase
VAEARRHGFRLVAAFPHLAGAGIRDYTLLAMAREAAAEGLPLQVGVNSREELADVAQRLAPSGATLLVRWMRGGGYTTVADVIAAGQTCPNLLFDVGTTSQSGAIELLVQELGARRLYVASNLPHAYEGAAWFMVWAARLSAADRDLIAGGTLGRLLGLDPAPCAAPALFERFCALPKLDTHWHSSGWNLIEPAIDRARMAETFDRFAYRTAVSSSIRALSDNLAAGNAETAAWMAAEPRVRGYVAVNPLQVDASLAEIERYRDDPRFVGIKTIQDFYRLDLTHPGYQAILDRVAEMPDWTVMAHVPGLGAMAERNPRIRFLAAHSTWRVREYAHLSNVHCDIATSTALTFETDLPALIAAVGLDRVVFSSDGQLMSPAWTLGKLASIGMSLADLTHICQRTPLLALPRLGGPS